jgi:DNA-binding PadR family transcriptional regulator
MSLTCGILGVLEAHPMSGYELVRFFDDSMDWVWSAPQSQIYPRLREMEQLGLVSGIDEVRGERLRRRVYSITDAGLATLRAWIVSPPDAPTNRDDLLLRAVFFDMVDPGDAKRVLMNVIAEQETLVTSWIEHRDKLLAKATPLILERLKRRPAQDGDRIAALKAHVFDGKIALALTRIEWARRGIGLLEQPSSRKVQLAASPPRRRGASPAASKTNAPAGKLGRTDAARATIIRGPGAAERRAAAKSRSVSHSTDSR